MGWLLGAVILPYASWAPRTCASNRSADVLDRCRGSLKILVDARSDNVAHSGDMPLSLSSLIAFLFLVN